MTSTLLEPRILETPAAFFRLTFADGATSSRESHTVTARRWGTMPDTLSAITDVVADPCWSDGSRFGGPDDSRPDVTVNGVTYTGTLYYVSRGYHIGSTYDGDNGWCVGYRADHETEVDRLFGHYWTGQHLTRYTDARGFQPVSDAALRKLAGWLEPAADELLADVDRLRAYWAKRFESEAHYALVNARRELEAANESLSWARRYGSSRPDVAVPVWGDDA